MLDVLAKQNVDPYKNFQVFWQNVFPLEKSRMLKSFFKFMKFECESASPAAGLLSSWMPSNGILRHIGSEDFYHLIARYSHSIRDACVLRFKKQLCFILQHFDFWQRIFGIPHKHFRQACYA